MAAYVILTAFLFQRARPSSRDPDGEEDLPSTQPPSGFKTFLYSYSLGIALAGLFISPHLWHGAAVAERPYMGGPQHSLIAHLGDMEFWFESFFRTGNPNSLQRRRRKTFHLAAVSRLAGVEACEREQQRDRALDVVAESTLRDEPLPPTATHLCIDMQRLFGGDGLGARVDAARAAADCSALRART